MYISPDTTVVLLRDCPLDNTYDHTIYFSNATDQYNYFYSLRKYTLLDQSYTRVNRGYIRVSKKSDDLYDCNYMMFQNKAYGNKWFYAFITSVEYVNNEVCEVRFEIDEMQTWHFDYTLKECFVEREHSATDVIGENLVPENLEQGDYVANGSPRSMSCADFVPTIVMVCTFNDDDALSPAVGEEINSVYSGLRYNIFTSAEKANDFIRRATEANKVDGIIGMFMSPFYNADPSGVPLLMKVHNVNKAYSTIDGYAPRNKKLFTSPYNVLHVMNDVTSTDYKYELFSTPTCEFIVTGCLAPSVTQVLYPADYAGLDGVATPEYRMSITDYPQCAWTSDVYAAWLAQNTGSLAAKGASAMLGVVVGGVASAATGNPMAFVGGASSALNSVFQTLGQMHDISTKPPQANGSQSSMIDFAMDAKKFWYVPLSIKREFAEIIDNFFDMFGYATHKVKVPNRNVRPHWTYVKTRTCVVVGGVPSDSMSKIISIYNNGITFWKKGSEVGNYSLDNRV